MATKIDLQDQPRGPADGTGEVTLALLREQFERSFVPRMSEDGDGTPMVTPMVQPQVTPMISPKVGEARIGSREKRIAGSSFSKIAGSSSLKVDAGRSRTSFQITP